MKKKDKMISLTLAVVGLYLIGMLTLTPSVRSTDIQEVMGWVTIIMVVGSFGLIIYSFLGWFGEDEKVGDLTDEESNPPKQ